MATNANSNSPIQSVERAAEILSYFTPSRPKLALAEITQRLGVSKATAHRYTMALRAANLLRYDASQSLFSLGPEIIALGAAARAAHPIITIAAPYMERLVRDLDETVILSIWDGEAPIVVRVNDNVERFVRISIRSGVRLPTFTSAQGQIFCAHLPRSAWPDPPKEVGGESFDEIIERVRREGVAVNSLVVQGIRAIAVPVFAVAGISASLAIAGTMASIPANTDSDFAKALAAAAAELSAEFGATDGAASDATEDA